MSTNTTNPTRWTAPDGTVVTASPTWVFVWPPGARVGTDAWTAGPFKWEGVGAHVTPDALAAWHEAWLAAGSPA